MANTVYPSTKRFNGKTYYLQDRWYSAMQAKSKAARLRRDGYLVRVVREREGDRGYSIYRRHR